MITHEEARTQQRKKQKKILVTLFVSTLILSSICTVFYFVGKQEFQIGLYISLFIFLFVLYKCKMVEFFHSKKYEGEVTYFNVRTESIKKYHSHQVGAKYDTYTILLADIHITDKKGKTRYKTFRHSKEYDNTKVGDKATVFRFVDKPIIEFQD